MDPTTASLTELKAAVYDQMVTQQTSQRNIEVLNAEITKRQQAEADAKMAQAEAAAKQDSEKPASDVVKRKRSATKATKPKE